MPDIDTTTPQGFKEARRQLGLSASRLGAILDVDPSTIRRWEMSDDRSTSRPPHPTAARVLQWMLDGFRPPGDALTYI